MKRVLFLLAALSGSFLGRAQSSYLNDNFEYNTGNLVGQGSWLQVGAPSANPVQVADPAALTPGQPLLTYTGYSASGGKAGQVSSSGQGVYKNFTAAFNTGSIYSSFLLRVSSAPAAGNYGINFTNVSNTATGNFGLLYIKSSGSGYQLGATKSRIGAAAVYSNTVYSYGTTYLVVMKYTINPGATNNDSAAVYVFASGMPSTEPPVPEIGPVGNATGNTDTDSLVALVLRQGNPAPAFLIDAVRVSNSWSNSVALPATLLSFSAAARAGATELSWHTGNEETVASFGVERSRDGQTYEPVCQVAPRNERGGATYAATDAPPLPGITYYRLKTEDRSGGVSYSAAALVRGAEASSPFVTLSPNPVAESAVVTHPAAGMAQLRVIDGSGRTVQLVFPAPGSTQTPLPMGLLPAGLYYAVYQDGVLRQSLPVQKN